MPNFLQKFPLYLIVVLFGVLLAGCGGGGSGDDVGSARAGGSSVPSGQESAVGSESVSERKVVLSWTAPSTREDSTKLSMGELTVTLSATVRTARTSHSRWLSPAPPS